MANKMPSFLAGLLLLLVPLSAQAQVGVIKGQTVNATTGEVMPRLPITLHITTSQSGGEKTLESESDTEGNFTFEGVELSSDNEYALCATYQNVMYHSPFSVPSGSEGEVKMDLEVYDTSESGDSVSLQTSHMVFALVPERGAVEVTEFFVFQNSGNKTFVGLATGSRARQTLRFSLPQNASELTLHSGLSEGEVFSYDGGFASLSPVFPGTTSVVYSYLVPIASDKLRLLKTLDYPSSQVVLLIGEGMGTLEGPYIRDQGSVDIEGTQYRLYGAFIPPESTALDVVVSGWEGNYRRQSGGNKYAPLLAGGIAGGGLLGVLVLTLLVYRRRNLALAETATGPHTSEQEGPDDEPK